MSNFDGANPGFNMMRRHIFSGKGATNPQQRCSSVGRLGSFFLWKTSLVFLLSRGASGQCAEFGARSLSNLARALAKPKLRKAPLPEAPGARVQKLASGKNSALQWERVRGGQARRGGEGRGEKRRDEERSGEEWSE